MTTRFHKAFLLFVLLAKPCWADTELDNLLTEARAGDVVTLTIHNSEPADSLQIYRKTGVTSQPSLVGSIPVQPDVWEYAWSYKMPGGSISQYRFFVVPKRGAELLGESNGVRVKRVK